MEGVGLDCPAHHVSTLSLPRKKLKLVQSQGRSIPVYSRIFRHTGREDRNTRRWYLVVIVLLYVGLLTSFSLNVSLLIRKEPSSLAHTPPQSSIGQLSRIEDLELPSDSNQAEFAYTTACLVQDPCAAGSYYSCSLRVCQPCPVDTYQTQWGQTSCWPCPNRTHTDTVGADSPSQCKLTECGKYSRSDLAVLETPNYPGGFPVSASCHWRVRPAELQTSLLILPSLSLPDHCSHTLSIRTQVDQGSGIILETCKSVDKPQLLTVQSSALYIDFTGSGNKTSNGFQISILSVSGEMAKVVEAVVSTPDQDRARQIPYNHKEDRLVSRLLSLLSPTLRRQEKTRSHKEKPLIEVVKENQDANLPFSQGGQVRSPSYPQDPLLSFPEQHPFIQDQGQIDDDNHH